MANFFKDNDDIQYYFDKGVDWESLVRITEHDFADADGEGFSTVNEAIAFYRDIIEMFGQFVAEEIKPYEKEIDAKGVELVDGEVVFPDRLANLPDAAHAFGECHQIAGTHFHGRTILGRHDDIAVEKIAGFLLIVGPGKG